jgi:glycosyltransferase involved in cell wall biosynthesis
MPLSKGLRIAVALPHLGVFGGIRRFLELGRVWAGRGHAVALLIPPDAEAREPWLPFPGSVGSLDRLRSERWDVVLSPEPALFLAAESPGALRVFYAVLERAPLAARAWRSADLVLANSSGMRRYLRRRGIAAGDGIGGVDLDRFHPPAADPRPERSRSGEPTRFLVYGRLSRARKGTRVAVEAIQRALSIRVQGGPGGEITLCDAAPPAGEAPPARIGGGAALRWVLDPSQEELADLYRDADVFVAAERRAGWCNTAAEAMACGAAVVCTPSGTEDFARHGETARVARFPWVWPVAMQIEWFLRDPAARRRIAAAGAEAIQAFSWERTAARVEEAIAARLSGGGGG